ncbi:MAG: hypothetical protein ICV77_16440 [Cyanobacteria bacterium Co-bin8]|nr:hypothetical protein [Cyanobacteria bacterium Co-bin8]
MSEPVDPCSKAKSLLRWWYQYQTRLLIEEADSLRNGVLQDVFALRRHLELVNQPEIQDHGNSYESCLQEVEHIYKSLQALSDRISSPYLEESLPLALQHFLQPWRSGLDLQVELIGFWETEPIEHIAVLLALLNQVLQAVTSAQAAPHRLYVSLKHQAAAKAFTLQVNYPQNLPQPLAKLSKSEDMTSLLQTFQWLSNGTTQIDRQAHALTWVLTW